MDEFSNLKGHKDFITTVVDLDKKILLDVIKGHKQEELMEALKAQPDAVREKVKEVSVDMWSGFTAVIKELFRFFGLSYAMDGVIKNETFIETDIAAIFVNCLRSGAN